MKYLCQRLLLSVFLLGFGISPAFAFQLLPISREFAPVGAAATQSYQIINDKNELLAVEISLVERHVDIRGTEHYEDADDDFLVFPSQILLNPGETQTVRVAWLGDPQPTSELAYRLIAEQVPVNLETSGGANATPVGNVRVLLRYLGSVFIHPANSQADVVFAGATPQAGANGEDELAITLLNQGNARATLRDLYLNLTSQGTTVSLQPEQLAGMTEQVILAGNRRRFVLPYPAGLPTGEITATFEFAQD